jgi:threonine dehydrogenase-like Zn-dependent dehydrogenase
MMVPERIAFKVPDNVPSDVAALVEPASIGFFGLSRIPFTPESTLLVMGTGVISMGGMACAKGYGIGKTILAGRKDSKLELGKKLGADILVNMEKEDLKSVVMRETHGIGATIVLDATGSPELLNLSISLIQNFGYLVLPGFYEKPINGFPIDYAIIRNCTIIGAAGTQDMQRRILNLLTNKYIDLSPMITHRYPFSKALEAFKDMEKISATKCKVMIDF